MQTRSGVEQMKLALISALLFSSTMASAQSYNIQFEASPNLPEKSIRWVVIDDISRFCQSKVPLVGNQRMLACSEYNNYTCTIYTGRTTDMAIVGHEIRHCFEGQWHR
jgi:hypothetical protein